MEQKRPRLGRGLSSLLSRPVEIELPNPELPPPLTPSLDASAFSSPKSAELQQSTSARLSTPHQARFQTILVSAVKPNPYQPRREMKPDTLAELSASIRSSGIIQPIVVRPTTDGFELIAGERRWRAAQLAGIIDIPAIIRDVDKAQQAQMALVENIHRENLNPIDRASSYRTLMVEQRLTQAELAEKIGEERSVIANFLRLLQLAEPVRHYVREGQLSVGHAKLLAGIDDLLEQQRLADLVVNNELSVRNLERMLQSPATVSRAPVVPSAHLKDLENRLSTQLGMRISLRNAGRKGAGRLTIHYGSLDQFDELVQKLGIELSDT